MVCAYRARIYPAHRPFLFGRASPFGRNSQAAQLQAGCSIWDPPTKWGRPPGSRAGNIHGDAQATHHGQLTRNAGEYWRVDGESGWSQNVVVLVLFHAGIRKRCTLEPRLIAGQAQQETGHGQAFLSSEGGSEETNDPKRRTKIRHNKTVSCAMMVAWSSERREQGIEADAVPRAPVVHN